MASKERDRAVRRFEAALVEQGRLGERFEAAVGTSTKFGAYVRLAAAGDQVRALEAWLNWLDDEGFRGLNAGPFELLAESTRNSPVLEEDWKVEIMRGKERHRTATGPAQRRGELHRADGDRRVGQVIKARRELATQRVGDRAWINGREVGGADPRCMHLEASHD
jgi:hypothetical protein